MNLVPFAVLFCRGLALALLLFGLCGLLPLLATLLFGSTTELLAGVRVSWTRYAPPEFPLGPSLLVALRVNLAPLAQVAVGAALLVFSRPVGGLLAAGLLDRAP